jgi:hypothetical protein
LAGEWLGSIALYARLPDCACEPFDSITAACSSNAALLPFGSVAQMTETYREFVATTLGRTAGDIGSLRYFSVRSLLSRGASSSIHIAASGHALAKAVSWYAELQTQPGPPERVAQCLSALGLAHVSTG